MHITFYILCFYDNIAYITRKDVAMKIYKLLFLLGLVILISSCGKTTTSTTMPETADLVVYTYQEESIYGPIIKEYQERTNLSVRVVRSSYPELKDYLTSGTLPADCDVIFAADTALLESVPSYWEPYNSVATPFVIEHFTSNANLWTAFSAQPLVIMYNTKIVTYQERPEGWDSLLNPRAQDKIAFMNPFLHDVYACALAAALKTTDTPADYIESFAKNINYTTIDSLSDLNHSIAEGSRSIGVTTEKMALLLMENGADIDYLHPKEGVCILVDGSAIVAGSHNPVEAKSFIDFTVSKDVQFLLSSDLHRHSVRMDIPTSIHLVTHPLDAIYTSVSLLPEYEKVFAHWAKVFPSTSRERW